MNCHVEFELQNASVVRNALRPELENSKDVKTVAKIKGKRLIIDIDAAEMSTLKAVINSYLRLVDASQKVEKL